MKLQSPQASRIAASGVVRSTTVHPVILSGGSGKRLWPLSRASHPKQFLNVLGEQSLFQETCHRLADPLFAAPSVIANNAHRFLVAEQLRERKIKADQIILEPVSRNTAPAAVIAALLAEKEEPDRLILLLPSDHAIPDAKAFTEAVRSGIASAERGAIVTFGVKPDRAHTGYGYIEVGRRKGAVVPVSRFVEKPDAKTAERFLADGRYLWNAGIFLFSARTMLSAAERHCPAILAACRLALEKSARDLDFVRLDAAAFATSPSISIDYAIIERSEGIQCVPLKQAWSDLGSWTEIWESAARDAGGNHGRGDVHFFKTTGSLALSDGAAVSVLGLEDVVVVATRDAVLVTSKKDAQSVKDVVEAFEKEGREVAVVHNRVHRPWGWYERLALGERYQVKCIMVKPGAQLSLQSHYHRAEHWIVVSGTCEVTIGGNTTIVTENQSTYVPLNATHRLANPGKIPALMIEVQSGSYLGEDDIVRFEDQYGRAG